MACIDRNDEFEGIRFAETEGANFDLIMCLMGELQDQVEESDEERLNSMIQSLEAEIINSTSIVDVDDYDHIDRDDQSWSLEQMDGRDCSITSFDDLDMNEWVDNMEAEPCLSSHDLDWYTYPCGDEMNDALDHGYYSSLY